MVCQFDLKELFFFVDKLSYEDVVRAKLLSSEEKVHETNLLIALIIVDMKKLLSDEGTSKVFLGIVLLGAATTDQSFQFVEEALLRRLG